MEQSIARETLDVARLLLEQADAAGFEDRAKFKANFQAVIVFARSVTLHIQKEYKHRPGFNEWYDQHQTSLKQNPICEFMLTARNYILKEGLILLPLMSVAQMTDVVQVSESVIVKVTRGGSWYRRSLKTHWQDFRRTTFRVVEEIARRFEPYIRRFRSRVSLLGQSTGTVEHWFFFDDARWSSRPAVGLVREYLKKLQAIVDDAEKRFAAKGDQRGEDKLE